MTDPWHPEEDLLVEVALGHAGGDVGDRVAAHLVACTACREVYRDLADAAELVLPAVPRVTPPPGLEEDVLVRLRAERAGPREVPRAPRRRAVLLAVAAGLAGVAVGLGAGTALPDRAPQQPPVAHSEWATPLVDGAGTRVGAVSPSRDEAGPVLVVEVTDAATGSPLTCRLVLADGSTRDVGRWQVAGRYPSSWVVPLPGAPVTAVEMVDEDGTVWAVADL